MLPTFALALVTIPVAIADSQDARIPGDLFGFRVAGAGDLDGDAVSDFLIADPVDGSWKDRCGSVWAVSGQQFAPLYRVTGASAEGLGATISSAGDVDGDGVPDFLASALKDKDSLGGVVRLFSGKSGRLLFEVSKVFDEGYGPFFGPSLCALGDVDNDGRSDFVIGSTAVETTREAYTGEVVAYSGKDSKPLWRIAGDTPQDRFGCALACAGDVDGDAVPDLLAAACSQKPGRSYVRVLSGRTGKLIRSLQDPAAHLFFAESIASGIDVDADGRADAVLTIDPFSNHRRAGAFSITDGHLIREFSFTRNSMYSTAVLGVPDLNSDGVGDVVMTSPGSLSEGSKYVVLSGRTGEQLYEVQQPAWDSSAFAVAIASVGDLDGDGGPELLVGEATYRTQAWPGTARIYSGKSGMLLKSMTRDVFMRYGK